MKSQSSEFMYKILKFTHQTYLQSRNRDGNAENRLMDIVGEEESGTNWENSIDIYTLPRVKHRLAQGSVMI